MSVLGELRLGFVALTDAAPLLVADELGLFADEGLSVSLAREVSWATIRDKVAGGLLDGAHMLAPIPLATRVGAGGVRADLIAPLALNAHSAAITLSGALLDELDGEIADLPGRIAQAAARRRRKRAAPLTFGVVFGFSLHAYLLRDWLAGGGVDPDADVRLVVLPPTAMVERLRLGEIDGFCVGAPWNAVAEAQGLGQMVAHASALEPFGLDKVFVVGESWAERNADVLQALLRALLRAGVWADAPQNREALIALLARPDRIGADPQMLAKALGPGGEANHILFASHGVPAPKAGEAMRLLGQMRRWRQLTAPASEDDSVVRAVCRADLLRPAAAAVGVNLPGE